MRTSSHRGYRDRALYRCRFVPPAVRMQQQDAHDRAVRSARRTAARARARLTK